ncbi:lysophospholipid acyltransferase family protein [Flavobacteriaceae bacterium LMO-SS05]
MKSLWLHTIRAYIRLGLFFYYKDIKVVNAEHVPKTGAVLFLANHQNALLDALLIATKCGRFSYFLTRASVFQNAIVAQILKSLLMLPVYRVRDGWNNLSKNNAIFKKSAELLDKEQAIVIFPEGSHHLNRTVRPLSKGFTRIIFETLEQYPETQLQMIPVGLNYVQAEKFGDSVSLYFGKPIPSSAEEFKTQNEMVVDLKTKVFNSLCELTTHIASEDYDATVSRLNQKKVDFLNPEAVNTCITSNFKNCEPVQTKDFSILKKVFKFLMILALIVPYLIWKLAVLPKIEEIEFRSTFRFVVAISIVPIYVLVLTLILLILASFKLALLYFFGVLILILIAVKL